MNGIEVQGTPELIRFFNELGKSTLTPTVIRDVSRKGAQVVSKASKDNMPYQLGDIGQQGKKNVVIKNVGKSAVKVTLGGNRQTINGRSEYLPAIIRHMTAGRQADRKIRTGRRAGQNTGRVLNRFGDFIEKGFRQSRVQAVQVMNREMGNIIAKKAYRARGIKVK